MELHVYILPERGKVNRHSIFIKQLSSFNHLCNTW